MDDLERATMQRIADGRDDALDRWRLRSLERRWKAEARAAATCEASPIDITDVLLQVWNEHFLPIVQAAFEESDNDIARLEARVIAFEHERDALKEQVREDIFTRLQVASDVLQNEYNQLRAELAALRGELRGVRECDDSSQIIDLKAIRGGAA